MVVWWLLLMAIYKYVRDKSLHFACIDVMQSVGEQKSEQEVLLSSAVRLVRDYFVEHIVEIKWPPSCPDQVE